MSYADDLDYFACALATLIGRDERAHRADRTPPEVALASRDIALTRLRVMCGLVTGTGPTLENFLARNITTDPAGALYSALVDLPLLSGEFRPGLVDLLTARPRGGQKEWQELARAALFLEPYSDALPELPGPFAWKVVGDIANVATGLPYLDEDLHLHRGVPAVDSGRHGALRVAAAQLESVRRDVNGDLIVGRPARPTPRPVHTVTDLARANVDLAAMVRRRGADISAPEIRAGVRALTEGLDCAARAHSGPGSGDGEVTIAGSARTAAKHLNRVLATPLATMNDGKPDPAIRRLGADMSRQFQALHALLDRLVTRGDPESRADGHARIAAGLDRWVRSVPQVAEAFDQALSAAHDQRRLLGRVPEPAPTDARHWHPLASDASATPPAVVEAVRLAREAIREACPASVNAAAQSRPTAPVPGGPARTRRAAEASLAAHPNQRTEGRRPSEIGRSRMYFGSRRFPGEAPGPMSR